MKAHVKVQAGICGFETDITAVSEDGMNVTISMESNCKNMKALTEVIGALNPINAIQELSPKTESKIFAAARPLLVKKGCCEACVVPVAVCKAMYVAANLSLPKDVKLEISKE